MAAENPPTDNAPTTTPWGHLPFRKSDQGAIAALVMLAILSIGMNELLVAGNQAETVDLSSPVARSTVQHGEIGFQIDVNRADWPEWLLLPRIGETLARRIVESRHAQGPFESLDDVQRVPGIGPKTLANMRPYLLPIESTERVFAKGYSDQP